MAASCHMLTLLSLMFRLCLPVTVQAGVNVGVMFVERCAHDFKFENLSREALLGRLESGDIFHAIGENGAAAICRVLGVNETVVSSRRITTQHQCKFDRTTGRSVASGTVFTGMITSVEPLPPEVHNTFLEMDRQYRLGHRNEESMKLTASQQAALLFIHDHYARYPIGE